MCAGTGFKCLQTGSSCEGEVRLKTALREGESEGKSLKIKLARSSGTFTSKCDYKSGFSLKSHQWDLIWCLSSANSGLGHWAASPAGRPRPSSSSFLPQLFWEAFQNKIEAAINISWMCLRVHVAQTSPSVASPADVWSTLLLNAPQLKTGGAPNVYLHQHLLLRRGYERYQPLYAAMLSNNTAKLLN